MKSLQNIVGILSILCVIGSADAALRTTTATNQGRAAVNGNARPVLSPAQAAARRLPVMSNGSGSISTGSSSTSDSSKSTTESDADCISDYTDCIKGDDACGETFEECVNKDLFHGKMPQCNSILLRCSSSAVSKLFGVSSVTALGQKDGDEFKYPEISSLMQQAIQAGEINNRLDTGTCVKKYMSCLNKDSVCGENFELCTSDKEFTKQRVYCESTLARCQDEGKTQLFGSVNTNKLNGRIGIAIKEGKEWAAVNAVSTCYNTVDECFIKACRANPYRCSVGTTAEVTATSEGVADNNGGNKEATGTVNKTKFITAAIATYAERSRISKDEYGVLADIRLVGNSGGSGDTVDLSDVSTEKDVSGYIQNACFDTIGANMYCHITFGEKMPSKNDLIDPDTKKEIFTAAYNDRMKKNSGMQMRIDALKDVFDKKAKDACTKTIMDCAMRSCGNGVGSKCYSCSKGSDGRINVNGTNTYGGIQSGCEAIVNTDPNCIYAASVSSVKDGDVYSYSYEYSKDDAFTTLFPETGKGDPINVVAKLNAKLAESYNDFSIEQIAKKCKTITRNCIIEMCGSDFSNCYRNRTDIMTDTYNLKESAGTIQLAGGETATFNTGDFNASMNKVNGILDFTVIRGLCNASVKNSSDCDEYLKITQSGDNGSCGPVKLSDSTAGQWGAKLGNQWGATAQGYTDTAVTTGYCYTKTELSACSGKEGVLKSCGTTDNDFCVYDVPESVDMGTYQLSLASDTLFQEVLKDLEQTAQAKYNAKLTKEQNKCLALNNGGVVAADATTYGDTYQWVKVTSKPDDYEINGLGTSASRSNDLYGSFCSVRVTLRSDEPALQDYLKANPDKTSAYFAAGDAFTCGSWLDPETLNKIATIAATKDVCQSLYTKNNQKKDKGKDGWTQEQIEKKCADGALDKSQKMKSWLLAGGIGLGAGGGVAELAQGLVNKYGNGNAYSWDVEAGKRAAVTASTAAAGYLLTGGVTHAVLKSKNREKFNEAQKEWLDEIGSHIQCYVGPDAAGSYGDIVRVTLD